MSLRLTSNAVFLAACACAFSLHAASLNSGAGSNGSVSPSPSVPNITVGAMYSFTATPNANYTVDNWYVNGAAQGVFTNSFTLNNAQDQQTVFVTFKLQSIPVYSGAGPNGAVTPTPSVNVVPGASQPFTATPASGFAVDQWYLDGAIVSPNPGTTLTLTNVVSTHTVFVTFKATTVTVNGIAGPNGTVSPTSAPVAIGGAQAFTASPASGFAVDTWYVNGNSAQTGGVGFTYPNITSASIVFVTFKSVTITVTGIAGPNGSVTPTTSNVMTGGSQTFNANPLSGFVVDQWYLNGSVVVPFPGTSYTATAIANPTTVNVTFKPNTVAVNAVAGPNGTVTPATANVLSGGNQTFNANPLTGFIVDQWYLNGVQVNPFPGNSYTATAITSPTTVNVTFKTNTVAVIAVAGPNGTVTPASAAVTIGTDQTFNANPLTGFVVDQWYLDGTLVVPNPGTSLTLKNVQIAHSLVVTFKTSGVMLFTGAGTGGTISPAPLPPPATTPGVPPPALTPQPGSSVVFTATPAQDQTVDQWYFDGFSAQTGSLTYTIPNVQTPGTVFVTFKSLAGTNAHVTATAATNGTVSPPAVDIPAQGSQLFIATPKPGYDVDQWYVDGVSRQPGLLNFNLTNAKNGDNIVVTFKLTGTVGGPSINASPTLTPIYGQPFSYTLTADSVPAATFKIAGTLPKGLTLNGSIISGIPVEAGVKMVTIIASNGFVDSLLPISIDVIFPSGINNPGSINDVQFKAMLSQHSPNYPNLGSVATENKHRIVGIDFDLDQKGAADLLKAAGITTPSFSALTGPAPTSLSADQVEALFEVELEAKKKLASKLFGKKYDALAETVKEVILDNLFQGVYTTEFFTAKQLSALKAALGKKDYKAMYFVLLDSNWAAEFPGRSRDLLVLVAHAAALDNVVPPNP